MQKNIRWNELTAVFVIAFSGLLFQVTATKIVGFMLWSNYAFFAISTAMFGLGLSGVLLTCYPKLLRARDSLFLPLCGLGVSMGYLLAFRVLNVVPIHIPDAPNGWGRELTNVGMVFLALGTPFLFIGLIMSYIFEHRGRHASVYYFADLIGAGVGSLALVPLIASLHPQGLVILVSLAAIIGSVSFAISASKNTAKRLVLLGATVVIVAAVGWAIVPKASQWMPLRLHTQRRGFNADVKAGNIEFTGWSALSRIDVASMGTDRKRVWIDGGMNESSILKFDGDFEKLRGNRELLLPVAKDIIDHKALPHLSKTNHTVCVIGTSGGEDSLYALALGARKVVGVEMDPLIVEVVTEKYRDFAGGLFTDGDYSEIIVDEGRSYLRRAGRQFDVIQQINNFTPIAFQNGALNLSETYLLTVESFKDFYDSLTDDGILAISRYGAIKCMSTAIEMFRRMGMKPEEYAKHMIVTEGSQWIINTFMMKKTPFTPAEVDRVFEYFDAGKRSVLYAPYRTNDVWNPPNNLYLKIATADDPEPLLTFGAFNFTAPTDNKPFFNRMKRAGIRDNNRDAYPLLPGEIRHTEWQGRFMGLIPDGDLPPLIILLEAFVLASVFFGLPMLTQRKIRANLVLHRRKLGYFAFLGLAFIFVEICMIQRLILFLGAPVYSLSVVLCGLLVSAGLGSLVSTRLQPTAATIRKLLPFVAGIVVLLHLATPVVTSLFLGYNLWIRMGIAVLLIGSAGFFMGMPMPTGIRYLKAQDAPIIPWAWAINAYFSVVGSALSVVLAMQLGFVWVFVIAAALYAAAPLFLTSKTA